MLSDEPTIEEMRAKLAANDYRFDTLVESIVTSPQFLNKRGARASARKVNRCDDQWKRRPIGLEFPGGRFLRGVGVTMALPWLESLPVWGRTGRYGGRREGRSQALRRDVHGQRHQRRITGGPRARAPT